MLAEADPNWLTPALAIGTAVGAGIAAVLTGNRSAKKKKDEPEGEAEVLAATFIDKATLQALTSAMGSMQVSLNEVGRHLSKTNALLEADAHRRQVEAEIREALAKHGIQVRE